ncbi:unnamed protein product [Bursaphelenchus okinawaensis]|uniref:Uncharacterized protein n=1 Tax=Bursaphelenchus okinawaensis TaxID=465554 RepID=A0A811LK05_9BILA|nr:unnamed protein product [Bursaphelenchus okinawaensis]CAG9125096.1 unnamed protein product [Bursaphelenchus okinawaensis]
MKSFVVFALLLCYAQGINVTSIVEDLITYPINRLEVTNKTACFDPLGRSVNTKDCTLIYQYCNGTWLEAYKLDVRLDVYKASTNWCWPDYQKYFDRFYTFIKEKCADKNDFVCQISTYPAFYESTNVTFNDSRLLILCQSCQTKFSPFSNPSDAAFDKVCHVGSDMYPIDLDPVTLVTEYPKDNIATVYHSSVGTITTSQEYCVLKHVLLRVPHHDSLAIGFTSFSTNDNWLCKTDLCHITGVAMTEKSPMLSLITLASLKTLETERLPYILHMMKLENYFKLVYQNGTNIVLGRKYHEMVTACNHTYIHYEVDGVYTWHCATIYKDNEYDEDPYEIAPMISLTTASRNVSSKFYCQLFTSRYIAERDMVTRPGCACSSYQCDTGPKFNLNFDAIKDKIANGSCYDSDRKSVVHTRSALCIAQFEVNPEDPPDKLITRDDIYAKSKLDIQFHTDKYCLELTDLKCYRFRTKGQLLCKCCCVTSAVKPCNDYDGNPELKSQLLACANGFKEPELQDQFLLPYLFSPTPTAYPSNFVDNSKVFYDLYTAFDTVMEYVTIRIKDRVVLTRGVLYFINSSVSSIQVNTKFAYLCNYNRNKINFWAENCKCALDVTYKAGNRRLDCCCRPNLVDGLLKSLNGIYRNYVINEFQIGLHTEGLVYRESTDLFQYLLNAQTGITPLMERHYFP